MMEKVGQEGMDLGSLENSLDLLEFLSTDH